mmetsp:Transcript_794/g.2695  ORF Transcript_794/g.2695 Transcript_794/m.2695 type:complete len:360 (-) Transcript_794:123-1202(-)
MTPSLRAAPCPRRSSRGPKTRCTTTLSSSTLRASSSTSRSTSSSTTRRTSSCSSPWRRKSSPGQTFFGSTTTAAPSSSTSASWVSASRRAPTSRNASPGPSCSFSSGVSTPRRRPSGRPSIRRRPPAAGGMRVAACRRSRGAKSAGSTRARCTPTTWRARSSASTGPCGCSASGASSPRPSVWKWPSPRSVPSAATCCGSGCATTRSWGRRSFPKTSASGLWPRRGTCPSACRPRSPRTRNCAGSSSTCAPSWRCRASRCTSSTTRLAPREHALGLSLDPDKRSSFLPTSAGTRRGGSRRSGSARPSSTPQCFVRNAPRPRRRPSPSTATRPRNRRQTWVSVATSTGRGGACRCGTPAC